MKEITKTWETKAGTAKVTGKLITEKEINLDGDKSIVPTCEIEMNITVKDVPQGSWIQELNPAMKAAYPGYTHKVGKLALTDKQVAIIQSVRDELESSPEWQAKQATIAKNQAEIEAYENSRGPGWCEKCQSYCYGDCEA